MKAKHYEALAKAIKDLQDLEELAALYRYRFTLVLCAILKAENPGFDENRFRELVK